MVEGRENIPAASAAYLNNRLQLTPYSVRYAPASGRGWGAAFG